jgi:hypothetical protein
MIKKSKNAVAIAPLPKSLPQRWRDFKRVIVQLKK